MNNKTVTKNVQRDMQWKAILGSEHHHVVTVLCNDPASYQKFIEKNIFDIQSVSGFFTTITHNLNLNSPDSNKEHIIIKYASEIKKFISSETPGTLITDSYVFDALIKKDKQTNFLSFLTKNKKNIVLFHKDSDLEFTKNYKTYSLTLSEIEDRLKFYPNSQEIRKITNQYQKVFLDPHSQIVDNLPK